MAAIGWILLGLAIGAIGALVALNLLTRPRKYRRVTYRQLPNLLRQLSGPLRDRGRIYVSHEDLRGWIWIQKKVRKIKPSTLTFRFRNADQTRRYFDEVLDAFRNADIQCDIELTPVRRKPRAIRVELDADQSASYAGLASLTRCAFLAVGAARDGALIVYAQ